MSFPPLNTLEMPCFAGVTNRQVLMNIEPTATCKLTPVCGDSCILTYTHKSAGAPLPSFRVEELIDEVLATSQHGNIRHIMFAAKEPTEAPEHILRLAKGWHSMEANERALSIGIISASPVGIEKLIPHLADCPLSSVLISIDGQSSGLRTEINNNRLLVAAVKARDAGSILKIGVNTTTRLSDLDDVLTIGQAVRKAHVDQWTVAGFCAPSEGMMTSVLNREDYQKLIETLVENFGSCGMRVTIDLPCQHFDLVGEVRTDIWRTELEVAPNVFVQTLNKRPGYFARVRWDGEVLGLEDALRVGAVTGRYGAYVPGTISDLVDRIVLEQQEELN